MRLAWIPEVPGLPLYRIAVPVHEGKAGERLNLLTADTHLAMQFETEEACRQWIALNPYPGFMAAQHGFLTKMDVSSPE